MKLQSMRARLTMWNVAVLALVLTAFGLILCYSVRANLRTTTDQELVGAAHDIQRLARVELAEALPTAVRRSAFQDEQGEEAKTQAPVEEVVRIFARMSRRAVRHTSDTSGKRRAYFRRPRFLTAGGAALIRETHDAPWDAPSCRIASAGAEHFTVVSGGSETLRVLTAPLTREEGGRVFGVVQLAYPMGEQERLFESQLRVLLMLIPVALLIAGAGGLFLTERALRPVRQVTRAAAEITADNLSRRLEVRGRDELAELSATFNGMTGRLEAAFVQLEHAYRQLEGALELQKRFTADASHELRTPLSRIMITTSLTLSAPRPRAEYEEALNVVEGEAERLSRIVRDLLLLARADAEQLQARMGSVNVQEWLEEAAHAFAAPEGPEIRLAVDDEELAVRGDAASLERLLGNLVENAVRHTPAGGSVTLSAVGSGADVEICVEDTGEGIAPEHLPHLCERFYRADASRSGAGGTGLGLAICQSIAQAHGGTLRIESRPGHGTRVILLLPPADHPEAFGGREGCSLAVACA